jgi:NTP pyrophosphatase (non-canonical NTP hydrolase)
MNLSDARPALDDELVDTFIYLIKIANQLGVDLEAGFLRKTTQNAERFIEFSK